MFEYHSKQTHSEFTKGKGRTKVQSVTIKGNRGTKSVVIKNQSGRVTKKSTKRLTKKEMECIRKCQFIPGLFKDCESCLKSF